MKTKTPLLKLLFTFLKIGLFTFGGGYAMIPLMQRAVVEEHGWLTYEEMLDIIMIAESTPGPISLNIATFVGYKRRGIVGSLFATAGLAIPSLVIIMTIAFFFEDITSNRMVIGALSGIKTAIVILVAGALVRLMKLLPHDFKTLLLIAILTAFMFTLDLIGVPVSGIFFIIAGALVGILTHGIKHYLSKRGMNK